MRALCEKLVEYWKSIGVRVRPGLSDDEIQAFEVQQTVQLPDELRHYFQVVDGMEEGETDRLLFEFLPLTRISRVAEKLVQYSGVPDYSPLIDTLTNCNEWFVFVDYLITSHVYAIRLTPTGQPTTPILWICGAEYAVIADSFSEFLVRYLENPNSIFAP